MMTVGEKLLDEIERVSAKRERWRGYQADLGVDAGIGLIIHIMTAEIDAAKAAIAADDAVACIAALQALEGYDDDD